jgi:MurNAc alpha-1-phosphate uridylyltransferase
VWSEGAAPALTRMLKLWNPAAMDCLLLLAPVATSIGYGAKGDFSMTPDGRLERRGERQVVPFAFAGVSLCDERVFKDAPDGRFSLNRLWDRALAKGRLYGMRLDGTWMHVGTPEALAEAETLFEREGA